MPCGVLRYLRSHTVFSLTQRCYAYMLTLFYDIFSLIQRGEPLPQSDETWTRKPYRKTDLDALKVITPDMPMDEITGGCAP